MTAGMARCMTEDRPAIPDAASILAALPTPIILVDIDDRICFVNAQAEEFLGLGANRLLGHALAELADGDDGALAALVAQARRVGGTVRHYGLSVRAGRTAMHVASAQAAALSEAGGEGFVALAINPASTAERLDHQRRHRGAARSVTGMAAMLAHEVKNPLSGIRGAAQLLEEGASGEDRALTRLICDEADRIVALVDRMEAFADRPRLERSQVNIHAVLEHVRLLAQSGFARHVRLIERYDPSLPAMEGDRDQLVQAFLNLVKNAAEACPSVGGEIILTTAYQRGVRLALAGEATRRLPLLVCIQDNGVGIPKDIQPSLFDPFVTTKLNGTGLGLALTAKIIGDHGGATEFETEPGRTVFKVSLPLAAMTDRAGDA
jgi:two-component system, NtrC family, nitrogen regulation sensor histidine kinase GlnL